MIATRTVTTTRRGALARALAIAVAVSSGTTDIRAADLPLYPHDREPAIRVYPPGALPEGYAGEDPAPASQSGYYGYYGLDIFGVPYRGLYSAEVVCLKSVRTPYGYRTVYIC